MRIGNRTIDVSNRDKVFFPEEGLTKGDLIDYYREVADVMLPHLRRYGVSLQRFPDGIDEDGFYQRDASDHFPDWLDTVHVDEVEDGGFDAPIVDGKAALVYLADHAVVTFHTYLTRTDDLEHPDRMIYDLDPPEGTEDFGVVRQAALDLRDVLDELDLMAWVQTTGSKGFHVVVPIDRSMDVDHVRDFASDVALVLVRRHEDRYTLEQREDERGGRVFLDTLRNVYAATAVAPYAVRARSGATVATPIDWDELADGARPQGWTLQSIPRRLGQKEDPWKGMLRHARSLGTRRSELDRLLEAEEPAEEEENDT